MFSVKGSFSLFKMFFSFVLVSSAMAASARSVTALMPSRRPGYCTNRISASFTDTSSATECTSCTSSCMGSCHRSMYCAMHMKKACCDMKPGSSRPRSCLICVVRSSMNSVSLKRGAESAI